MFTFQHFKSTYISDINHALLQRYKIATYDDNITTWLDTQLQLDPRIIFTVLSIPVELRTPFTLTRFIESLKFDHILHTSDRYTAFFGSQAYSYGRIYHHPKPFSDNPVMAGLVGIIHRLFPYIRINSALINYYPTTSSYINFHADDEDTISPDSYIFSITFGYPRALYFRHKFGAKNDCNICTVTPDEWDLLIFSRKSQNIFKHSIPAAVDSVDYSTTTEKLKARLSITFRTLNT